MATVNAGNALNMQNLQLANLNYGNVPIYDSATIRVDDGGGAFVDFHGSFTYAGGSDPYGYGYYGYDMSMAPDPSAYYPTAGTVTQVTEMTSAGVSMDVTGLSVDAPTLFNMLQAHSTDAVLNTIFGGNDSINGSAGADTLDAYGGNDTILGGAGNDAVRALDGNDSVDGGAGDDDVNGNTGTDVVHGGTGNDTVRGGQGNDSVFGDDGDDGHVNGNIGDDIVHGNAGNDTVFGGQGNDQLFGDDGNDQLSGDLGNDTMTGGAGADRFQFRVGGGADVITDFNVAEGDRVLLATGTAFTMATVNGSAVISFGPGDSLTITGVAASNLGDWVVFG